MLCACAAASARVPHVMCLLRACLLYAQGGRSSCPLPPTGSCASVCATFASPTSASTAAPRASSRVLDGLQSRCSTCARRAELRLGAAARPMARSQVSAAARGVRGWLCVRVQHEGGAVFGHGAALGCGVGPWRCEGARIVSRRVRSRACHGSGSGASQPDQHEPAQPLGREAAGPSSRLPLRASVYARRPRARCKSLRAARGAWR